LSEVKLSLGEPKLINLDNNDDISWRSKLEDDLGDIKTVSSLSIDLGDLILRGR
jgi:hypothetical protein